MAKFRDVAEGQLARRAVEFPLPSGRLVTVAVVPLFGESEAEILAAARAYAQAHGVPDPKKGDELYEFGIWVHTVVRGVVDPDSPVDNPQPFFDGGVAQILDPRSGLGREWIALLFEAQQAWQDELAPRPKEMGAVEYFQSLLATVETPPRAELPFFRWRRALQSSWLRTTAALLLDSQTAKSTSGLSELVGSMSLKNSASQPTSATPKPSESAPSLSAAAQAPDAVAERKA